MFFLAGAAYVRSPLCSSLFLVRFYCWAQFGFVNGFVRACLLALGRACVVVALSVVVSMSGTPAMSNLCLFCRLEEGLSARKRLVCSGCVGRLAIPTAICEMCADEA